MMFMSKKKVVKLVLFVLLPRLLPRLVEGVEEIRVLDNKLDALAEAINLEWKKESTTVVKAHWAQKKGEK